jgi:hypothetical protein
VPDQDLHQTPGSRDRTPHPDPTKLTTEQTFRETAALRELVFRELDALRSLIFMRIDGVDKTINEKERFSQDQFAQRDIALTAALAAAKEAVAKQSEAADKATIKSEANFASRINDLEKRHNDLKDRFTATEGNLQGKNQAGAHTLTIISLAIAILSIMVGVYMGTHK